MYLLGNQCKKMIQQLSIYQVHKCQYKKHLLNQLLHPKYLQDSYYKWMRWLMHTFQEGKLYSQKLKKFLRIWQCWHSLKDTALFLYNLVHRLYMLKYRYFLLQSWLLRFHLDKQYKKSQ